ncbi:hypothetical protein MPC4_310002 [Methylocella tundrae]|uniref:Uncharacterized protein n=1 Tax=Methylocella tundrae TaxID=227605 RepID=A0A8B6M8K6_METTU|nr:hypothetical protein MPC4_310002 [Methylocella tundrae]
MGWQKNDIVQARLTVIGGERFRVPAVMRLSIP